MRLPAGRQGLRNVKIKIRNKEDEKIVRKKDGVTER